MTQEKLWIDSHCHLDYFDQPEEVINRALDLGVERMLSIATKPAGFDPLIAMTEKFDAVYGVLGIHPHHSHEPYCLKTLKAKAQHKKIIGIGETGMDYHYLNAPRDKQEKSFRAQVDIARQLDLPVIIHTRAADDDTMDILEGCYREGPYKALIHSFTSGSGLAARSLDLGFYISVSGILTFKNSDEIQDIIKTVPLDRLLIETDAPYLTPEPHRGKQNEPGFVGHVGHYLAELMEAPSVTDFAAQLRANFYRLFSKIQQN
jgi:TatD DNase family protein